MPSGGRGCETAVCGESPVTGRDTRRLRRGGRGRPDRPGHPSRPCVGERRRGDGQMPFLWATALLLGAVALWRRGRRVPAVVLAALAQVTHPAVLMPITAGLVAGWLPWEADRRALLRAYAVSALVALPAALLVY